MCIKNFNKIPLLINNKDFINKLKEGVTFNDKLRIIAESDEKKVYEETLKGKFEIAKKANKELRKNKIDNFKKELSRYKIGFGKIVHDAIELVKEKPDISEEEFEKWFNDIAYNNGFNPVSSLNGSDENNNKNLIAIPVETVKAKIAFEDYKNKHDNIKKLKLKFSSDNELFNGLYGNLPKGKIEIINGVASLYIRCWDIDDYITIYFGYKKDIEITEEDKKRANKSGGISTQKYNKELKASIAITAENNDSGRKLDNDESKEIFIHEEQHVIYEIFNNIANIDD